MSRPIPKNVRLDRPRKLFIIDWSDGTSTKYPWTYLRANCPSAGEVVARQNHDPLAVLGKIPSSEIIDAKLIGSYAISFTWGDGHHAGIYTWEFLHQLASSSEFGKVDPS